MSLKSQLLSLILFPVLMGAGFIVYFQTSAWHRLHHDIEHLLEGRVKEVRGGLEGYRSISLTLANTLASNIHVRKAVAAQDLDALFAISSGMEGIDDIHILFLDTHNEVIVRNYDEYRFGDIVSFKKDLMGSQMITVDGKLSLGAVLPIELDGIDLVGYVLTAFPLDSEGLKKLVSGSSTVALAAHLGNWRSYTHPPEETRGWAKGSSKMSLKNGELEIVVAEDKGQVIADFVTTSIVAILLFLIVTLVVSLAVSYFLSKNILRPMGQLLGEIHKYTVNENPNFLVEMPNQELGRVGRALNKLHIELEERNKETQSLLSELKSEKSKLKMDNTLLQVICHDLNNPLTVIKGSARLLARDESITRYHSQSLDRLNRAVRVSGEIIHDVREMALVRSGLKKIRLERMNLFEIVEDCHLIFEEALEQKGIELRFDLAPDVHFVAEKRAFSNHVLNNLVSNSIKFSSQGDVITVRSYKEKDRVIVEVEDQGEGIPEEMIPKLFESAEPTSRTGTGGESGTGFGLPLVYAYMNYFGGSIEVASKTSDKHSNHGTVFRLSLQASGQLKSVERA